MGLWRQIRDDYKWYNRIEHRSRWAPRWRGFWITINYRFGHWAYNLRVPVAGQLARLAYGLTNFVVSTITSSDIRAGAIIGPRFTVHTSRGLLITNGVRIGERCLVNNGVCIVHRADQRRGGVASIGDHVTFGVGAKVLGPVRIGDGAVVGANAVVLEDVPDGALAVGVPAVIKMRGVAANGVGEVVEAGGNVVEI